MLSFRLKLPGTDKVSGLRAVSTSFRVHGLMFLEGGRLVIQWGGAVQVQDVSPMSVKDERELLPEERVSVPVSHLYRATLVGGWWRPRLTLEAKELGALAEVPTEEAGAAQFWYARGDRAAALAMAAGINAAIAAASQPLLDEATNP